jgi:hypothetical protein
MNDRMLMKTSFGDIWISDDSKNLYVVFETEAAADEYFDQLPNQDNARVCCFGGYYNAINFYLAE